MLKKMFYEKYYLKGAERGDNLSPSCQNFPEEYIPEEVYDTQVTLFILFISRL